MRSIVKRSLQQFISSGLALAALLLAARPGAAVGTQRIELHRGDDFKGGELQGVSIDSNGKLRAGFNLGNVPLADAASIWSVLVQKDGSVLIGTGNEGRLFKYSAGKTTLLAEAKGMTLSALAEAWDGGVVAGSIASGTLLRWQGGKLVDFSKLAGADHVYCLAYDAQSKVLYAGTGPEGKLFRITANGDAQVYFDADEEHLVSVAVGHSGRVLAGASDKAKLYDIAGPGRASVLYDFGRTEVRGIAVSANDEVYAIANEIKEEAHATARRPVQRDSAVPVAASAPAKGKGTLFRFSASGVPEKLIDDADDYFVSLALAADNRPYVGTGVEGRVYTVDDAHSLIVLADTPERQVTALALGGTQRFVFSSDPAVIHPVRGVGGADAVWTSKTMDLQLRAKFGRMSWLSTGTVELSTRTGNTSEPDKTWSDWSPAMTDAGVVQSPAARYIQVRARFNHDAGAELSDVIIPIVRDNLRQVITSVDAEQPADDDVVKPGADVKGSGGSFKRKPEHRITLKWKVENPDADELAYRLQYRLVGGTDWYDMLRPTEYLTKDTYKWDTSALPEGRYRVRVQASDEIANPPGQVTHHELESSIVVVDNTPPSVLDLKVQGHVVSAVAVDGVGPIARMEISLGGSDDWYPFNPVDGVFDEQREELSADIASIASTVPVLLNLRIYDQAGNSTVRSVPLK